MNVRISLVSTFHGLLRNLLKNKRIMSVLKNLDLKNGYDSMLRELRKDIRMLHVNIMPKWKKNNMVILSINYILTFKHVEKTENLPRNWDWISMWAFKLNFRAFLKIRRFLLPSLLLTHFQILCLFQP